MFGKIKQFFGFVGIEVALDINTNIPKEVAQIEGKVVVTAKAKQHITSVRVTIYEQRTTGTGDQRRTHTYDMGKWEVREEFDIDDGEFKEFPFTLQFSRTMSTSQQMSEQGGVIGVLGAIAKVADNQHGEYYVSATADVKGAALDPTKTTRVYFVG